MATACTGPDPAAELRPVRRARTAASPRPVPALRRRPALEPAACRRCAAPLTVHGRELICGRCLRQRAALRSRVRAVSVCVSARPVDPCFQVSGHSFLWPCARKPAGGPLVGAPAPIPELIVPVPLHPLAAARAGVQPGERTGAADQPAAGHRNSTDRLCRRIRATADQTELDARARRRNVRHAFEVSGSIACDMSRCSTTC